MVGVPFWSTLRLKCPPTFVFFVDRTDVKPSLLTKDNELPRYMKQDEFEVNVVIVLQDEHLVTENFPIKMIRYENNGDDS